MNLVVVLPDLFRGVGARRNSSKAQQSGHAPRFGPEVKNRRSNAKDDAPERICYWVMLLEKLYNLFLQENMLHQPDFHRTAVSSLFQSLHFTLAYTNSLKFLIEMSKISWEAI